MTVGTLQSAYDSRHFTKRWWQWALCKALMTIVTLQSVDDSRHFAKRRWQ